MALHYDFSKCNPVPHVALKSETDPKLWAELTPKKGWILSNDGTQKELPSLYFCEQKRMSMNGIEEFCICMDTITQIVKKAEDHQ
jgi:hypothetical protein